MIYSSVTFQLPCLLILVHEGQYLKYKNIVLDNDIVFTL